MILSCYIYIYNLIVGTQQNFKIELEVGDDFKCK